MGKMLKNNERKEPEKQPKKGLKCLIPERGSGILFLWIYHESIGEITGHFVCAFSLTTSS